MDRNIIINGNCLDEMKAIPSNSIDLIFADPPYYMRTTGKLLRPDGTLFQGCDDDWDKFETLEEYVDKILPLKIEDDTTNILARIGRDYHRLDQFDIGKLDKKDYVEKNMLLLGISRQIFTHSLPLVATEQCYIKLLEEIRKSIELNQFSAFKNQKFREWGIR